MKECVSRIYMSTQCSATTKFFGAKVARLHNFYMSLVIIKNLSHTLHLLCSF